MIAERGNSQMTKKMKIKLDRLEFTGQTTDMIRSMTNGMIINNIKMVEVE
jgi:hypothetical protein